jgi:hypothetical protein
MRCYGNTGMAEEWMTMRHLARASNFFPGPKPSKEFALQGIDKEMEKMMDDGYQNMQMGEQNC